MEEGTPYLVCSKWSASVGSLVLHGPLPRVPSAFIAGKGFAGPTLRDRVGGWRGACRREPLTNDPGCVSGGQHARVGLRNGSSVNPDTRSRHAADISYRLCGFARLRRAGWSPARRNQHVAPPTFALLDLSNGKIVASESARNARAAGFDNVASNPQTSRSSILRLLKAL
jgi:hypothetical protein